MYLKPTVCLCSYFFSALYYIRPSVIKNIVHNRDSRTKCLHPTEEEENWPSDVRERCSVLWRGVACARAAPASAVPASHAPPPLEQPSPQRRRILPPQHLVLRPFWFFLFTRNICEQGPFGLVDRLRKLVTTFKMLMGLLCYCSVAGVSCASESNPW